MITAFFVFVLGAVAGSFLSALLHRMRFGGSVLRGRSRCVSCKLELSATDLVPIASYLWRRGKCRQCRAPIGWQYLGLEIGMGAVFLASLFAGCGTFQDIGVTGPCLLETGRLALFTIFLAGIFVYDARYGEIPDALSVTGTALALVINLIRAPGSLVWLVLAAAVGSGFFLMQHVLGRGKWIGTGDIVLGAMLGMMVGWPGIVMALFFAYLLGLAVVSYLLITRRKKLGDSIPLGPFLTAGALIVLLTNAGSLLVGLYG
jgi:prepilin signal peptidase PulO-like enzyme (type II secretory pathway)